MQPPPQVGWPAAGAGPPALATEFCHNGGRVFPPQEIRAARLVASAANIRAHQWSIPAPHLDFVGKKI